MSENTTDESTVGTTPNQEPAQEIDWKAESRKWEERAKANKATADRVPELEQQLASLNTKVEEVTATSNAAVEEANLKALRYRIAAKHKVSEEDVDLFLTASDEETLEKQAQRISQHSANAPKPDPSQGKRTGSPSTPKDDFAAAFEELMN